VVDKGSKQQRSLASSSDILDPPKVGLHGKEVGYDIHFARGGAQ
jgi:hypothetical protein